MILKLRCHKIYPDRITLFRGLNFLKPSLPGVSVAILLLIFPLFSSHAQERCAIIPYENSLRDKGFVLEPKEAFENWLIEKKRQKLLNQQLGVEGTNQIIYTVPVVFHVVHNGEAIGKGTNLADGQILSQLDVLNEDFRRKNLDAILTPAEFLPVAADPEIEFVLAKQDPDGFATTGITRTKGPKTIYDAISDNTILKETIYWPAEDYINIWIAPLAGSYLGYATFPITTLQGIDDPELNRLYDGLVIAFDVVGSADKFPAGTYRTDFDKGRTTTHEMGHLFGLRHISGDNSSDCTADDFCLDTPFQLNQTNGCPNGKQTCGSNDMYQNYLDYTDDRCMNIFTQCQKDRMRTVLENSPRRLSLLSSHALDFPLPINFDLAISDITSPATGECDQTIIPSIIIRNIGLDNLTEATIKVSVNGIELETKTFAINLANNESTEVFFTETTVSSPGSKQFDFEIQSVNGGADLNPLNNNKSTNSFFSFDLSLPALETFDSFPLTWNLINADESITWEIGNAISYSASNSAAKIRFYDYSTGVGNQDYLVTPLIDLSGSPTATLIFDRAYATFPGTQGDNLKVAVSLDCGVSFPFIIYNKNSSALQTAAPTILSFVPSSEKDWKKDFVDLSAFAGLQDIQIAFIGTNGFGNNLYIDNVKIVNSAVADISIASILAPDQISCQSNTAPTLLVTNSGTISINNLTVTQSSNGVPLGNKSFTGLNLTPGNQTTLVMDAMSLDETNNQLSFEVKTNPEVVDFNPDDNLISSNFIVVSESEYIPLRQRFDELDNIGNWVIANNQSNKAWEVLSATNGSLNNFAASVKAWGDSEIGSKSSLISPALDFSLAKEASVQFKVSYATTPGKNDILRLKVSTDCGATFTTIYEKGSTDMEIKQTSSEWFPQSGADWIDEYVNLTTYRGLPQVIFSFEFANGGGNNLFLDDIEFYTSNDPFPVEISDQWSIYPNPSIDGTFDITLNLDQKQEGFVSIVNSQGKIMYEYSLENALNQTIGADLSAQPTGIYFVIFKSEQIKQTKRIIIKP